MAYTLEGETKVSHDADGPVPADPEVVVSDDLSQWAREASEAGDASLMHMVHLMHVLEAGKVLEQ